MSYHVEEVARTAGVSVDTVRYYQRKGLLPAPSRDGRRASYDEHHLTRLRRIRALADDGFSLSQIEKLLQGDAPVVEALAELAGVSLTRTQVARRAGVPEAVVDVVVATGLIRPDGELFDSSAVDMLTAAAALVDAGVPIDELLALAANHAGNIDAVADRAIDVFRRHVKANTDHDTQLAGTVAQLMPHVTRLVAQHFQRTLVEKALVALGDGDQSQLIEALAAGDEQAMAAVDDWIADTFSGGHELEMIEAARQRAARTRRDQFVVARREIRGAVDPLALLVGAGAERSYWSNPDGGTEIAGLGTCLVIEAAGPDRFERVTDGLGRLRHDVHLTGEAAPMWAGPLLVGGFSYFAAPSPSPRWGAFVGSRLVLPRASVVRRGGRQWLYAVERVGHDAQAVDVQRRLEATIADTRARLEADLPRGSAAGHPTVRGDDRAAYEKLVSSAVTDIAGGLMGKVVTARSITVVHEPDVVSLLDQLRTERPSCATTMHEIEGTVFVASTPELLVRLSESRVETAAVAATVARAADPADDRRLIDELRSDRKQLAEHAFVIDAIRERLEAASVRLEAETPPGVLTLPSVLHLYTPVRGAVHRRGTTVVDLVGALHPTPAVSGAPLEAAEAWLAAHERLDRGWYAAPIGFVDLRGDGEFWVGLRSALISAGVTHLFVGAGIVAESDPASEYEETVAKLQAMLRPVAAN